MASKDDNFRIVSVMSEKEQRRLILLAKQKCFKLSKTRERENTTDGEACQVTWDSMLCWDKTPANTVSSQPCPDYVNGFNTHELATKVCTENGTWWVNPDPEVKHEWTNFSDCVKPAIDLSFHATQGDRLRLLYSIGYSCSLGALVVAVAIMLCYKRLQSKSNSLHINLFLAFILRAVVSFLKDVLFVGNVGLAKDVNEGKHGVLQFIQDDPHWECKLIFVIFTYTINSCNMWIFCEALYLTMLVYRPLATERRGVRLYIILGWTLPLAFIIPWTVIKALYENTFCWNIQHSAKYYWIIKGPGIAVVGVNFLMFLNILRKLFLKLRHTSQLGAFVKSKYRKLAKFILVLVPLFGVMYIVFYLAVPSNFVNSDFNLAYMYLEMTYNSFQGFLLALLFCFLNGEVHGELKRAWNRYKSRRNAQATIDSSNLLECIPRRKSNNSSYRLKYSMTSSNVQKDNITVKRDARLESTIVVTDSRNCAEYSSSENPCSADFKSHMTSTTGVGDLEISPFHSSLNRDIQIISHPWDNSTYAQVEDVNNDGHQTTSEKVSPDHRSSTHAKDGKRSSRTEAYSSTSCVDIESRLVHERSDSILYDLCVNVNNMNQKDKTQQRPEVTGYLFMEKGVRNEVIQSQRKYETNSLLRCKWEDSCML